MKKRARSERFILFRSKAILWILSSGFGIPFESDAFTIPINHVQENVGTWSNTGSLFRTSWSESTLTMTSSSEARNEVEVDPLLPAPQMTASTATGADFYFFDINDHRYSASDWLHNLYSMKRSSILREIKNPVLTITLWSTVLSLVHCLIKGTSPSLTKYMCLSSTPLSFMVSALGLLLVFRTNSAYQRFSEGRRIWEQILSTSRNLTRLTTLYEKDVGMERKWRIFRLLGVFPYALRLHVLGTKSILDPNTFDPSVWESESGSGRSSSQENDGSRIEQGLDNEMPASNTFPWSLLPQKVRRKCAESDNAPLWICDRLSQEVVGIAYNDNFTSRERSKFLSHVDKLSQCVGESERIHQTAVPKNYARHSLRGLTIWLLSMPFALIKDFGLLTGPVMCVMAWLMFGVYQIGASIEDPFQGSLRLRMLCDVIYRDVIYGERLKNHRNSAFQKDDDDDDDDDVRKDSMIDNASDSLPSSSSQGSPP